MAKTQKQAPKQTAPKGTQTAIAKATGTSKSARMAADTDEADEADESTGPTRQWAREMARAHAGVGNAAKRCADLAEALAAVAPGKGKPAVRVSFAKANELANLRRGATGNPVASWRLAVQRMRQVFGGADMLAAQYGFTVSVDGETGSLVVESAAQ